MRLNPVSYRNAFPAGQLIRRLKIRRLDLKVTLLIEIDISRSPDLDNLLCVETLLSNEWSTDSPKMVWIDIDSPFGVESLTNEIFTTARVVPPTQFSNQLQQIRLLSRLKQSLLYSSKGILSMRWTGNPDWTCIWTLVQALLWLDSELWNDPLTLTLKKANNVPIRCHGLDITQRPSVFIKNFGIAQQIKTSQK